MADEDQRRLELWRQQVEGQSVDTPASAADYAWSDYTSAEGNLQNVQAAQPPQSLAPGPPMGGVQPGEFGFPEPDNIQVDAAKNRIALAKMGLQGADTPPRWEGELPPHEQSVGYGELESDEESNKRDSILSGQGWSQDLLQRRREEHAAAQEARGRMNAVLHEDIVRARQAGEEITAQRVIMQEMSDGNINSARARAAELQDAFDQAAIDMDSVRVDPQRWEKATPALAQVFMALASSAFAFFNGGRGVNPVVALIDRAIDRDLKAQMKNADNKLKKINLGLEGAIVKDKLQATMETAMYERAAQGLKFMVDNTRDESGRALAQAAYQESLAKVHEKHVERMDKYMMAMAKQRAIAMEKQQKAQAKQEEKMGAKWDDPTLGRTIIGTATQVESVGNLYNQWKESRVGDSTFGSRISDVAGGVGEWVGIGSTDMHEYSKQKEAKILEIAAQKNRGRPTDKDQKLVAGLLPTAGINQEDGARRTGKMLSELFVDATNNFKSLSKSDRYKAEAGYKQGLKKIIETVKQNPELAPHIGGPLRKLFGN